MNKFAKIVLLYILFGFIIALAVTFGGAYSSLVVNSSLGYMSNIGYFSLMALLVVGWIPALISSIKFNIMPDVEVIATVIFVIFIGLSAMIIKRKK